MTNRLSKDIVPKAFFENQESCPRFSALRLFLNIRFQDLICTQMAQTGDPIRAIHHLGPLPGLYADSRSRKG
jgi:hypothetical protein